jgi:hypothetical protein
VGVLLFFVIPAPEVESRKHWTGLTGFTKEDGIKREMDLYFLSPFYKGEIQRGFKENN